MRTPGSCVLLPLFAMLSQSSTAAEALKIAPSELKAIAEVDERYQSYNIEMAEVIGGRFWKPYEHSTGIPPASSNVEVGGQNALFEARSPVDLSDKRLLVLAGALGPAYLRVSGTWANSVFFQDDDSAKLSEPPPGYRGVLTRSQWRGVVQFARAVNADLVTSFTISSGVRDPSGAWIPREAQALIDFTHSIGGEITAAELFNEPNVPTHGAAPPKYDAAWFAKDEAAFRQFTSRTAPKMRVVGPGDSVLVNIVLPEELKVRDLLASEPKAQFDIFSYHFYGAISQRCAPPGSPMGTSAQKTLSDEWLAQTDQAFDSHAELRDEYAKGKPIWLTETAEAACGGDPWAATYVDSFRYLDQMGRLAKRGLSAIFHNTLDASEYGLIDPKTLQPRPNYWAALLWRRLMGTLVLDTGLSRPSVHLYAHCLRRQAGGVALMVLNMSDHPVDLSIRGQHAMSYTLTADTLESRTAKLNGSVLNVGSGGKLPVLQGKPLSRQSATLEPHSIQFIAVPTAGNAACH